MKKTLSIAITILVILLAFQIYNKKIHGLLHLIHFETPYKTVVFNEPNSKQIYITLKFKNAGVLHNSDGKHGISPLLSKLLFRKIEDLSAEETEEKIQQLGITNLSLNGTTDNFLISFSVIEDQFEPAVKFLLSGLKAKFSENDLSFAKEFFPIQVSRENSRPNEILIDKLYQKLYPNHSYGKNSTGSSVAISSITLNDIYSFLKNNFAQNNLKIYYAGSYSKRELKILTDELSKYLPKESNQHKITDLKNIEVDNSDEKISNDNIRDICGVTAGIRFDKLSKQEKAALLIITYALFNENYGDFLNDKFPMNFSYAINDRELSSVLVLSSFVHQKDADKYMEKLKNFLANLDLSQLKNLKLSRNYFIQKQRIKSLRSIHNSLTFLAIPFSDCSNKTYQQILDKIKQPKNRCIVSISSK